MSTSFGKKIQVQGLDEENKLVQKQGIVTILGLDSEKNRATDTSLRLRRTLSADMSSNKWLSQNGFSPMENIASSEELLQSAIIADTFSSSEGDDDCEERKELESEAELGQFDIWSSIQRDKKEQEKPGQFDIWSSIVSQKANEETSKSLPPPYIHPLVNRSQSSLSEKSLEICTESLGCETGSDVLSSYPPSESGDTEEDKEQEQEQQQQVKVTVDAYEPEEDLQVPKYNYSASSKKSPPRSFPPPLPSLSRQDGPSLHMRSHRDDGRLVLEAVSVPSQNNFCAQRQDGRLVLTFNNHNHGEDSNEDAVEVTEEVEKDQTEKSEEDDQEEKECKVDEREEEEVGEIGSDDIETVIERQATVLSGRTTGIHRLALMMNKPIGLVNSNPKWSEKFNEMVSFEDVNGVEPTSVAQSLTPRPRVARLIPSAAAAATSFNVYEYYWRTNPTAKAAPVLNSLTHQQNNSPVKNNSSKLIVSGDINHISYERHQLLVLRGKNGDYLVHNLKSCKESRRSILYWEPYCIATS